MIKFFGTSAIQAHPVNEFGAIIDGEAIANILSGGTESMVKFTGTSALQYHPIDEFGNIIDATAIANGISGLISGGGKTEAPGTIIRVNGATGNDANDGFIDEIATLARAYEVLQEFDFRGQNINLLVSNLTLTSFETWSFSNITGINALNIAGSSAIIGSGGRWALESFFNLTILIISGFSLDQGLISLFGGNDASLSNLNIINHASGIPVSISNLNSAIVEINDINNLNCTSVIDFGSTPILEIQTTFGGLKGTVTTTSFLRITGNRCQEIKIDDFVVGPINVTGQAFSSSSEFISIDQDSDTNTIIGTLASTFTTTTIFNGKQQFIQGIFDDNADALTGGLTAGDFYITTGLGANPLNVAGIVMQVQ